jgi:hypothetical protein
MPAETSPPPIHDKQPLNPLDAAIRAGDRSIRGMGYPGFETQMLVWLSGRLDAVRLKHALSRLALRRPVITARLMEDDDCAPGSPYWAIQGTPAVLHEVQLPDSEPAAVNNFAAELLSKSHDLQVDVPLRFFLLRRPHGQDVFLMQYSHVLMDKFASVQVLREIDGLSRRDHKVEDEDKVAVPAEPRNLVHRWLMRLPCADRRAASSAAIKLHGRILRGRAAILGTGDEDQPRRIALQIATRSLDPDFVRALHDRSAKVCGLPNLSMAILASAFRTLGRLGPPERNADRSYVAGIGLDMKHRRHDRALLQNLISVVPIFARPAELADHDQLVRNLSGQIRERLRDKVDWGVLRLANAFQRKPRHIRWVMEHLTRWTYSLWYAYFGPLDAIGDRFCGVPIGNAYYIGPTWSPMGLSLLVNQFQGQMCFQATYDPELAGNDAGEAFLDLLLEELQAFAAG